MALQRQLRIVDSARGEDMTETALMIAFATSDMQRVDQHFGSARSFAIYAVDMEQAKLLQAAQFGQLAQDGDEDKLAAKLELLEGCAAVYCQAAGSSAITQLLAKGIQPVKVSPGVEIKDLLESLQEELRHGPSAWLAKAVARQQSPNPGRFDAMEAEGWED